jgi:hypothetical protein
LILLKSKQNLLKNIIYSSIFFGVSVGFKLTGILLYPIIIFTLIYKIFFFKTKDKLYLLFIFNITFLFSFIISFCPALFLSLFYLEEAKKVLNTIILFKNMGNSAGHLDRALLFKESIKFYYDIIIFLILALFGTWWSIKEYSKFKNPIPLFLLINILVGFFLVTLYFNKSPVYIAAYAMCISSLLPIFLILDSVFILSSLKNGLTNAILAFRFNTQPIGVLGYTTLLFFPIVLSVAWARNKSIVNYFLLILITFTNLLTGFRILLINAFFLLVIYNYRHFHSIKTKNKVIGLLLFLALLLFFESLRGALESNNSEALFGFGSLLQSVGRSLPIRYIAVALREHVIFDWTFSLNVFTEPFSLILSTIFSLDKPEPISIIVANPVVRAFLVWRGTSDAISSGFSINILANAFILDGFLGLLGFSIILGIFLGIGLRLLQAQSMINRLVGTCFITFVIGSSESFGEAWKLLVYWTVFLFGLVFYSRLIQNLAFAKTLK